MALLPPSPSNFYVNEIGRPVLTFFVEGFIVSYRCLMAALLNWCKAPATRIWGGILLALCLAAFFPATKDAAKMAVVAGLVGVIPIVFIHSVCALMDAEKTVAGVLICAVLDFIIIACGIAAVLAHVHWHMLWPF